MDDELKKALLEILGETVNAAKQGVEFLKGEIPDVISQLLLWNMIYSIAISVGALVLAGIIVTLAVKVYKTKTYFQDDCGPNGLFVSSCILCFLFFPGLLFNLTWLKIMIAPKLYLIEYAATLAK